MKSIKEYAKEFATLGGKTKSKARAEASRINGKKGGRPIGSKNKKK